MEFLKLIGKRYTEKLEVKFEQYYMFKGVEFMPKKEEPEEEIRITRKVDKEKE